MYKLVCLECGAQEIPEASFDPEEENAECFACGAMMSVLEEEAGLEIAGE